MVNMKVKNIYMVLEKQGNSFMERLYELENGQWVFLGQLIKPERAKQMLEIKPEDENQITFYKDIEWQR